MNCMITQPCLFSTLNSYQKLFHSQFTFSLKIFNLVFHHIKGEKEVRIPSKGHLFQASLLTLILISVWKTCVYFGDVFLDSIWPCPEMHLWYLYVFILSALFTEFALIKYFVVIIFIRYDTPWCFPQTCCCVSEC